MRFRGEEGGCTGAHHTKNLLDYTFSAFRIAISGTCTIFCVQCTKYTINMRPQRKFVPKHFEELLLLARVDSSSDLIDL